MKHFDQSNLMEGYIIQVRHTQGSLIQKVLKSWACHDALVVRKNGILGIGDMRPMFGRVTSLSDYERAVAAGLWDLRVLSPSDYQHYDGLCASHWWVTHEDGKLYNFIAYPLLYLKALLGDCFQWSRDLTWDWCTEGCMEAWLHGAEKDYWRKAGETAPVIRPTPLTTEHRLSEDVFQDVTANCFRES